MSRKVLPFPATTGAVPRHPLTAVPTPALPRPRRAPKAAPTPLPLARAPRALTDAEIRLQTRILDGYFRGRRLAQGHEPTSVQRDRVVVEHFLAFVGQPLWACTTEDFESWAGHRGLVDGLAPNSQRTAHTAIATFFDYAADNTGWQNEVHTQFQGRTTKVVIRENRMIHVSDAFRARERRYLTADEFDQVMKVVEAIVEVAATEAPRMLKTFQRDRALVYTYYAYGLRLAEGQRLDVHSFAPNPDLPELGCFGTVGVHGKGSRGSGPRYRTVPAVLPDVEPMLTWYLEEVRPKFPRKDPDDPAMWLSEQGRRLCRAAIAVQYKRLIEACGLNAPLFSPHGLRHMHISHQAAANVPVLFTSRSVGHHDSAITAKYTHLPDDYARSVAYNFVRASLEAKAKGDTP